MKYLSIEVLVEILRYVPLKDHVLSTQHVNDHFREATFYTLKNYLSFEKEYWVNGANVMEILSQCRSRLKHLNLTNCYWLNSEHFRPIYRCSNLTSLELVGCKTITGKCLLKICSGLSFLSELSLTVTEQLVKQVESELESNTHVIPKLNITSLQLEFDAPKRPTLLLDSFITNFLENCLCPSENGLKKFQIFTSLTEPGFWNLKYLLPEFHKYLKQAVSVSVHGQIYLHDFYDSTPKIDRIHQSLSKFMNMLRFLRFCTIHRFAMDKQGELTELSVEFLPEISKAKENCERLKFPNLMFLQVKHFTCPERILEQIEAPNLHTLKLSCHVADPEEVEWMNYLERFPSLKHLHLFGKEIPSSKIPELCSDSKYNTQMESISLSLFATTLSPTDNKISRLFCSSSLTEIKLNSRHFRKPAPEVTSDELSAIANVTSLQSLTLENFSYLHNFRFLVAIAKGCQNLRCLNLIDLGASGLATYIQSLNKMLTLLPHLQDLRLEHQAFDVTTSFVSALMECRQLQTFSLHSIHGSFGQDVFPLLVKLICDNQELVLFKTLLGSFSRTSFDKMIKALKKEMKRRPALRIIYNSKMH